jgi:arylsulfatase A-like enzyme
MTRRSFIKSAAAGAAALSLMDINMFADEPNQRPNVLFVLADQWRFSAFSHGTDPLVRTPHFDAFVKQGARWTRTYSANPLCTPNRSAIITSRFPHQTGMIHNDLMLPPEEKCLAELFHDAGYATHYIGKWHMDGQAKPGFVPKGWRRRGFTTFEGFNRGHNYYKTHQMTNDGKPVAYKGFEPVLQTDLAIEFMKKNKANPFLCFLSWGPPHTPYKPPKKFNTYKAGKMEFRPNVPEDLAKKKQWAKWLAGYYGLCESLDHEFGRLMKSLDELGLSDNTLVIFTSDHGDMIGCHGKRHKTEPEEESLHVPLFMRLPDRTKPGQETDILTSSIDLMPTILSLCKLGIPDTCTGKDLSGVLTGKPPEVKSLYAESKMGGPGKWRAVVTPQYKLAYYPESKENSCLYDLQKDPYELKNLINDPAYRSVEKELMNELMSWAKRTGDPFPETPEKAKEMYADSERGTRNAEHGTR